MFIFRGHHYIGVEEQLLLKENGLSVRTTEQKEHYKEVAYATQKIQL